MNQTELIENAIAILEQIDEELDYVVDELTPIEHTLVAETFAALIQSNPPHLTLCDNIQTLVEEVVGLRELLVEEPETIAKSQQARKNTLARKFTPDDSDAAAEPEDPARKYEPDISQKMERCNERLNEDLPVLKEEEREEVAVRRKSLWERLGLADSGSVSG